MSNKFDVYDLEMHETMSHFVDDVNGPIAYTVIRVPGGWIYTCFDKSNQIGSSVFVPYKHRCNHTGGR